LGTIFLRQKTWSAFFPGICSDFQRFSLYFRQIISFWHALAPAASYTTAFDVALAISEL